MTIVTKGMGKILKGRANTLKGTGKKTKGIKNTDPNFRKGAAQALKDMKKKGFIGIKRKKTFGPKSALDEKLEKIGKERKIRKLKQDQEVMERTGLPFKQAEDPE
jgi:hypothetical protein